MYNTTKKNNNNVKNKTTYTYRKKLMRNKTTQITRTKSQK